MLWAGPAAQPSTVVNVPYPKSSDEAAQRFLCAVDEARPRAWTTGMPSGAGPHLACGVVQAIAKGPDGGTVLMIDMPCGDSALTRCSSPLPEVAVGQKLYLLVDFNSPDGPCVARLRGICTSSDLGNKSTLLNDMLGIHQPAPAAKTVPVSTSRPTAVNGDASAGGPLPAMPMPTSAAPGISVAAGLSSLPTTATPPAATAATTPNGPTTTPSATPSPTPHVLTPRPPATGDASYPSEVKWGQVTADQTSSDAADAARVAYWKEYIAHHNQRLTDPEREAIVRWVMYYSAFFGVDHRLIFAVMRQESDFDPGCLSHAGAMGLMQLMPATCKELGVNPWVVEDNIRGGIQELSGYLDSYAGRSNYDQCILSLACYNAGAGAVKRAGGVPNIPETQHYVKRVSNTFAEFVHSQAP